MAYRDPSHDESRPTHLVVFDKESERNLEVLVTALQLRVVKRGAPGGVDLLASGRPLRAGREASGDNREHDWRKC